MARPGLKDELATARAAGLKIDEGSHLLSPNVLGYEPVTSLQIKATVINNSRVCQDLFLAQPGQVGDFNFIRSEILT